MSRKEELLKIFEGMNDNVLTIVSPMIDDLVFIEEQLEALRKYPFIKTHPKDPTLQKATPAGRLYSNLLGQEKDIVRILCSLIHKSESGDSESPLRIYLKGLETRG